MRIRNYEPRDREACRDLWAAMVEVHRRLYEDDRIGGDVPGLSFDRHLAEAGERDLWVAEEDGEVVGMAGIAVAGGEPEVLPLVVAPAHRRRGAGTALLERAVAEAERQGLPALRLHPVVRNREALAFLHARGFTAIGTVEVFRELRGPAPTRRPGPDLHGLPFEH